MLQVELKRKEAIVAYLKHLRDKIIAAFEGYEKEKRFQQKKWGHHGGGGGEISLLRGDVFEKAAVNWSGVQGTNLPFKEESGPFLQQASASLPICSTHLCPQFI